MTRDLRRAPVALAVASFMILTILTTAALFAAAGTGRDCPLALNADRIQAEIAGIQFVEKVPGSDGNSMEIDADTKDDYRIALVTLQITKPANEPLTIAAADLTLHYYFGNQTEVAACEGLSVITNTRDTDRAVKMPQYRGPGFVKQSTGNLGTQASTVYVDAVFGFIEPDISEAWIAVARPSTSTPFKTSGWKN
jgi:hypothetical protein